MKSIILKSVSVTGCSKSDYQKDEKQYLQSFFHLRRRIILKSIIAKISTILSIIFIVLSICSVSSVDCLKGVITIQKTIINKADVFHGIISGDITPMPYILISLFYISLFLILLSSVISFTYKSKIKSIVIIVVSVIPSICVLLTHNYIWFLILLNIYLFFYILFNNFKRDRINICVFCFSIAVCFINILELVNHLNLDFSNNIDMQELETALMNISKENLLCLLLWIILYFVLIIKDIVSIHKS